MMKNELTPAQPLSVCLIGSPPSERFHSMDIYEMGLAGGLYGIEGIDLRRQQWPATGIPKNKYLSAIMTYWNRSCRYPMLLNPPVSDLYHILDHSYAHLITKLPREKTIITCHDLMPMMVECYENTIGGKLSLASFRHSVSCLNKARHILADSGATKNALIDILKLADKNITVVPLGVDEIFCPTKPGQDHKESDKTKYILQVGATAEPYKNTMNILRSFSLLFKRGGGQIKLLKVGKPYTKEQLGFIESEGLAAQIRYLGFVDRKELPKVYRQASVLLMPSLYEGFGMPLLEAMASGIPVVASRRGSIPEVAGEAAFYVDPDDPKDIARGVEKVLNDSTLRQDLITKGLLRAKAFTWKRTAEETLMVYRKIIDSN
ncbi:MAG: glycosyltransferase family 1 protein [bacterium]|nr:glycosyltransferase family 1 protein [bacterium]